MSTKPTNAIVCIVIMILLILFSCSGNNDDLPEVRVDTVYVGEPADWTKVDTFLCARDGNNVTVEIRTIEYNMADVDTGLYEVIYSISNTAKYNNSIFGILYIYDVSAVTSDTVRGTIWIGRPGYPGNERR